MWLSDALIRNVEDAGIRVFYVSYAATRRWAAERDKGQPLVFSGHYWSLGGREAGPFKSRSGAYRDAWYRVVHRRAPPVLTEANDLFERERNMAANTMRKRKRVTTNGAGAARP